MPLSDAAVRATKPRQKPFKRADDRGLYLLVQPNGTRLWRMNYSFAGRQKTAAFGVYPAVSLSEAREHRDAAKKKLRAGIDPGAEKVAEKIAEKAATITFAVVSDEWLQKKMVNEKKSDATLTRTRWLLDILNKGIGGKALSEIGAPELLAVLRRIEAGGKNETVKRLRATASTIFRYGIATGACERDPAADLKGALTSAASTPRSAVVDPAGVGELLRAIDGYKRPALRLALQLLALTFVRPGELVSAEWSEIDVDDAVWSIPAAKMKMRLPFRIPLSRQALAVLEKLHKITGHSKFLFPSRTRGRHIWANRLNVVMREIGYTADEISAHGFRSTASTILNEHSEFSPDAIELSLAHQPQGVRSLYNRARYWIERRELMQWYGDYLDGLRKRGEVVKLPKRSKVDA
jgi:integrase